MVIPPVPAAILTRDPSAQDHLTGKSLDRAIALMTAVAATKPTTTEVAVLSFVLRLPSA